MLHLLKQSEPYCYYILIWKLRREKCEEHSRKKHKSPVPPRNRHKSEAFNSQKWKEQEPFLNCHSLSSQSQADLRNYSSPTPNDLCLTPVIKLRTNHPFLSHYFYTECSYMDWALMCICSFIYFSHYKYSALFFYQHPYAQGHLLIFLWQGSFVSIIVMKNLCLIEMLSFIWSSHSRILPGWLQ